MADNRTISQKIRDSIAQAQEHRATEKRLVEEAKNKAEAQRLAENAAVRDAMRAHVLPVLEDFAVALREAGLDGQIETTLSDPQTTQPHVSFACMDGPTSGRRAAKEGPRKVSFSMTKPGFLTIAFSEGLSARPDRQIPGARSLDGVFDITQLTAEDVFLAVEAIVRRHIAQT